METTWAGAHSWAKRPPFTPEKRLRRVLISTISAPQTSRLWVSSSRSAAGMSGFSNKAEPPPESRNSTVSCAVSPLTRSSACWVAVKLFSSGMGCPASRMVKLAMGPLLWSYLVMTIPVSMREPRMRLAALAICQAPLPAATSTTRPEPKSRPSSALRTASSGWAAVMAA